MGESMMDMEHDAGGNGDGRMMMHMTFFWGNRVLVLFSGWPGDSGVAMYLLSLLFVFCLAALLEALSALSHRLSPPDASATTSAALLHTALHAVRMGLAYLVMLAVMSFNVGVLLAAVAGHAFAFLFATSGLFLGSPSTVAQAHTTDSKF